MFDEKEPVVLPLPMRSVFVAEIAIVPAVHAPVMVTSPCVKVALPVPLTLAESVQVATRCNVKFALTTNEQGPTSPVDAMALPIAIF